MANFVEVQEEPIDFLKVLSLATDGKFGAISTFFGMTRDSFQGKEVLKLEYEAYLPMAKKKLEQLCDEIREKWNVGPIVIVHRIGTVHIAECSVAIVIGSVHREDSLLAVHYGIDRLKETVPIWKKEFFADGTIWKQNALDSCCQKTKETSHHH